MTDTAPATAHEAKITAELLDVNGRIIIVEKPEGLANPALYAHVAIRTFDRALDWYADRVTLLELAGAILDLDLDAHPDEDNDGRDHAAATLAALVDELRAAANDPAVAAFRESQLAADGITDPQPWSMLTADDSTGTTGGTVGTIYGRRTWRRRYQAALAALHTGKDS